MKTLQFKIIIILICITTSSLNAQKLDRKYTEKFIVDPNVIIDVNTRHTDIEIETWNKNEVVIEAFMQVEGESDQDLIDDYFRRWNFEALGNKSNVKVTSKSSSFIDINSFDFDTPNYDILVNDVLENTYNNLKFIIPEISVSSLGLLDSIQFIIPEIVLPPLPAMPPIIFNLDDTHYNILMMEKFDFKKHKKDNNYLKRWKEKNKKVLEGYDIKIGRNSISISNNKGASKEELKKRQERLEARMKEQRKRFEERLKKRQKEYERRAEELKERNNLRSIERKKALVKRQEALKKQKEVMAVRRKEVRSILERREKVKIRRIIKIKAPKNAKFNMNVKYGSMSFPN